MLLPTRSSPALALFLISLPPIAFSASAQQPSFSNSCRATARQQLLLGKHVRCNPKAPRAERTIPAKWISDLAPLPGRLVRRPINISNAVIEGAVELQYATFRYEIAIKASEFTGPVKFSFATFNRSANFESSQFRQEVDFRGAHAKSDFEINRTQFLATSTFEDLQVDAVLAAMGAQFRQVSFERIEVAKSAFFLPDAMDKPVSFADEARFLGAHIHGNAEFDGAQFKGNAAFYHFRVEGSAFFRPDRCANPVEFGAQTHFHSAHIYGQAEFQGAQFRGPAEFTRAQLDGIVYFDNPQKKGSPARFQGTANFAFTAFGTAARFSRVEFLKAVKFENAQFRETADFTGVHFARGENANFIGARFEQGVSFKAAVFDGPADFTAAIAGRDAWFSSAQFSEPVTFREAKFQSVFFAESSDSQLAPYSLGATSRPSEPTKFGSTIDLRGFTYDRIQVSWAELLRREPSAEGFWRQLVYRVNPWRAVTRQNPFDREPYVQLEAVFRKVGGDDTADDVYLERRRAERQQMFVRQEYVSWLWDWIYKLGANYGVRPYRLILYALFLILLGAAVFSQPGALDPKEKDEKENPRKLTTETSTIGQAFGVSVNQFFPIDVPWGADRVPASRPIAMQFGFSRWTFTFRVWPSIWATFCLRIAGAILMAVGIAAVTGLLRRVAS